MEHIDELLRTAGLTASSDQQDAAVRGLARSVGAFHQALVESGVPLAHVLYLTTAYLQSLFAPITRT